MHHYPINFLNDPYEDGLKWPPSLLYIASP